MLSSVEAGKEIRSKPVKFPALEFTDIVKVSVPSRKVSGMPSIWKDDVDAVHDTQSPIDKVGGPLKSTSCSEGEKAGKLGTFRLITLFHRQVYVSVLR